MIENEINHREDAARRSSAKRAVPFVAAGVAAALTLGVVVTSGGGAAGAADIKAQSVGRFVDGALGGMPIQSIADLKDARAKAPGTQSQQNPLDAKLLGQAEVPIGNALKLPGGGAFTLGAANQVAVAKTSGYSYGASGAVSNSGGVSAGGDDNAYPADAKVDISDAALGSLPVASLTGGTPIGSTALGGVSAGIGAVSAIAKTKTGGELVKPTYKIASLDLTLASPALAALLKQLVAGGTQLKTLLAPIVTALGGTLPASCNLTNGTVPDTISLDGGAVVIDPNTGSIKVSLSKLLDQLGANLNSLPANTDLLAYVLNKLPGILSNGLENVVNGLINPIKAVGNTCIGALGPLAAPIQSLVTALTNGQKQIETAVNTIADMLGSAGGSGLGMITDQLAKVVDIGVNVQQGGYPLSSESKPKYKYTPGLESTPDQATPVVDGQGVVRALELDLLDTSALSTNSLSAKPLTKAAAAAPLAVAAAKSPGATLALGNAAAGPSTVTAVVTTAPSSSTAPTGTALPTGVPAGQALHDNSSTPPVLLAVLALLALMLAGGGTFAFRRRTGFKH